MSVGALVVEFRPSARSVKVVVGAHRWLSTYKSKSS